MDLGLDWDGGFERFLLIVERSENCNTPFFPPTATTAYYYHLLFLPILDVQFS
jgi:hypothetical protein